MFQWFRSHEENHSARNTPAVKIINNARQDTQELLQQIQERPELQPLATDPLMLAIMVNLSATNAGAPLPDRRVDLYRDIIRLQLGDRPSAKKIDLLLPLQDSQRILQKLALWMVQENCYALPKSQLLAQLSVVVEHCHAEVDCTEFLTQMEEVSEILVKVDDEYEFAHRNFQSFLSAREIIDTQQAGLLLANWPRTEWKETILMYASLANANIAACFTY